MLLIVYLIDIHDISENLFSYKLDFAIWDKMNIWGNFSIYVNRRSIAMILVNKPMSK